MKKKVSILVLICFCTTIIGAELGFAYEMQRQKQNIAMMNLVAMDELSQEEANLYSKRILREFGDMPQYNSLGQSDIANRLRQNNINPSDCYTNDCAVQAGKILGADFVVIGSLSKTGSHFSITMKMVSVQQGVEVNSVQEEFTGNEVQFLDYLSELTPKMVVNQPRQPVQTVQTRTQQTQPVVKSRSQTDDETIRALLDTPPPTEIKKPVQQQTTQRPEQTQQIKKKSGSKLKFFGLVLLAGAGAALYFLKIKDGDTGTTTDDPIPTSPLPSPPAFPKK